LIAQHCVRTYVWFLFVVEEKERAAANVHRAKKNAIKNAFLGIRCLWNKIIGGGL
jgi:hypothetical protein